MFAELEGLVVPGAETLELDRWVQDWIRRAGGIPAFLGYGDDHNPFPAALCISINEEVIHGIPGKRILKEGDLVSLDCGINYKGYFSDMALTMEIGTVSEEARLLNQCTRECLYKAIEAVKAGNRIHDVSRAVMNHAQAAGYGVVSSFCGHGVGLAPHEDPQVPNIPHGPNPRIQNGLVFAIEPMINLGTGEVELLEDDWTVVTADGSLSAHWEHSVVMVDGICEVLTLL